MYTSAFGHIIECSEYIWGLYTDIIVSYVHMKYICGFFMTYPESSICVSSGSLFPVYSGHFLINIFSILLDVGS